jgi:hypothetical protein
MDSNRINRALQPMLAVVLLALASSAAAEIRTVQLAHEVALADLRLPQSDAGTIGFKPCDECDYQTERVSAETRWSLNGRAVSLDDFRLGLARVTERNSVYITVLCHLEQNRVTEVSVYLP